LTLPEVAAKYIQQVRNHWSEAKENILEAQQRYKHYYDQNRKDVELRVGDLVLLKQRTDILPGDRKKLYRPWQGPYAITQRLGELNFKIQGVNNPDDVQSVSVQRLKRFFSRDNDDEEDKEEQEPLSDDPNLYELENIEGERMKGGRREYLVKFKGYRRRRSEWIPEQDVLAKDAIARWKRQTEAAAAIGRNVSLPASRKQKQPAKKNTKAATRKTNATKKAVSSPSKRAPATQTRSGRQVRPSERFQQDK